MKIIGFATQFYTLWDYEAIPQYKTDSYGNHHQIGIVHNYCYCKNISTDLEKVKSMYPNITIDNGLRGTKSFTRSEAINLPNNYFWYGKYAGKLIDEIIESDFGYCLWSAENYNMPYILSHPKYLAHFKAIEEQKQLEINMAQTVKVGDVIELEFVRNGYNADDKYTECWADAILGDTVLNVLCSGVKLVNGMYPYLMPVINGKAQKTKGKMVQVKVLEVFSTLNYSGKIEQKIKIA